MADYDVTNHHKVNRRKGSISDNHNKTPTIHPQSPKNERYPNTEKRNKPKAN